MGKSIDLRYNYVKHSNPVVQKALIEVLNQKGVKACLMEDTDYSDGSREIKILITIPKP